MGHVGCDELGGDLYFVYVPPDPDSVKQALMEKFAELDATEVVEMLASRIWPEKPTPFTQDRYDLISRVIERLAFEFLGEVKAEFLWPLYERAKPMLEELSRAEDPKRMIELLDLLGPLVPEEIPASKYDHYRTDVTIVRRLEQGVLTKEIKKKPGRPLDRAGFWRNFKDAVGRVERGKSALTLENVAGEMDVTPRTLTRHCKKHCSAPDGQHFKRAIELCRTRHEFG